MMEVMTLAEVAAYLRCSKSSIYRLVKERGLPSMKLGSDYRFSKRLVDQWVDSQHAAK